MCNRKRVPPRKYLSTIGATPKNKFENCTCKERNTANNHHNNLCSSTQIKRNNQEKQADYLQGKSKDLCSAWFHIDLLNKPEGGT